MKIYKEMFQRIIEPLNSISLSDLNEAGERLKGAEGESDNISNAIGETILRIARLRGFADMVLALCGCGSNLPASINGVACPSCFADTGRP